MVMNWNKSLDLNLAAQLRIYFSTKARERHVFVTVSREFGCDGSKLVKLLVEKLNIENTGKQWFVLTREQLIRAADGHELTEQTLSKLEQFGHSDMQSYIREAIFGLGNDVETVRQMAKVVRLFADRGRVVFLGGGAPMITADMTRGLHIRYYAPLKWRIKNYANRWGIDETEAHNKVLHKHSEREEWVKAYLNKDTNDKNFYDLCLNNARLDVEHAANLIASYCRDRESN